MKTALIISVYKNTADLAVVLKSVEQQSVSDFITADFRGWKQYRNGWFCKNYSES